MTTPAPLMAELIEFKPNERKPPYHEPIEVSYDNGKTWDTSTEYSSTRTCILAGSAGGFGYFKEGFATNGENGCDKGLICDDPDLWRFSSLEQQNEFLTATKLERGGV